MMYLVKMAFNMIRRCIDRGCKLSIKKDVPEDWKGSADEFNEVNSMKTLQSELEDLYTGPQISSSFVYAQIFTTMWSCLTFSSGMPILYPIAAVFYFVMFYVNKFLLLKYFAKTARFGHNLPRQSVDYMKWGMVFHMIIGALMFTNSSIIADSSDIEALESVSD